MPKILCVTSHDPGGTDYGASLRARHIFQLLSHIGDVSVVLAGDTQDESKKVKQTTGGFPLLDAVQFQPTGKWSFTECLRNEFDGRFLNTDWQQARASDRERLQQLMTAHDLVWVHTLKVANRFALWRWPNSVLDIDDIPSALYRTSRAHAHDAGEIFRHWRQTILWRRRERFLSERFDALCVCSEQDRQELGGSKKIFVLPNGFEAPAKTPARNPATPPRLGFVGTFKYEPNRAGVRWFVKKVWPLILEIIPQARLRLVGTGSENGDWQNTRNVDALGFVEDMASEMATWAASVVPLFVGGGTRIKIAESFSRQCPVVSTSVGAYGYDVADGRELLLADAPVDFAAQCLRILTDATESRAMAVRAREKFLACWTWDAQADRVAAAVESVWKKTNYGRPIVP